MLHFDDYFTLLHRAVPTRARVIQPRSVAIADGSAPQPHQCHNNVDRWVSEGTRRIAVRGWLVSSWTEYGGIFDAHSVVEAGPSLFDITPLNAVNLRFIRHAGAEEDFQLLRTKHPQFVHSVG